jgi:Amt family ammonium transporter
VGGVTGALLTGVFADARWGGTNGLLFGHPAQLGLQAIGVLATVAYSAAATYVVLRVVALVIPLRATNRAEGVGMDITQHGEEAYAEGEGAVLVFRDAPSPQHAAQVRTANAGAA